jgi:FMN-dependent dehydrogenase
MKGGDRVDEAPSAKGAENMERFLALHEFEPEARQRLPHAVYEYVAGGAGEEHSIRANEDSYQRIFLRPRLLRSVGPVDLGQELFGRPLPCARPARPGRLPTAYASGGRAWLCPGRKPPRRAFCPQLKRDGVDRGDHGGARGSVLVPDLRSRRPRVHARLDRAGRSGWL